MAVVRDIEPWDELLRGRPRGRAARHAGGAEPRGRRRAVAAARGAARRRARRARRARDRAALLPPGRGAARRLGRPDDRHHGHGVGQVAVLPAADARRAQPRRRARARSTSTRPRRSRRTRRGRCTRSASTACARRSTTATRRASSAPRSAAARTWCSPTPTCCTSGSCPTTARGPTCSPTSRSWSSTRRTSTAACSARTSATCCGGCGAIADAYGTEPRFLLASATIANPGELAERLTGLDDFTRRRRATARPAPTRTIAMWNPPITDEKLATRALRRSPRPPTCWPSWSRQGARTIVLHEVAQGGRADREVRAARARGHGPRPTSPTGSRPTAPATRRSSGASSSAGSSTGELLGVVSTDALELGIDIGSLDAAICVTFPGTVASLRQKWGRAGRRGRGLARLRGGRGRARPVLLPPPRRVPRPAGRGGDPRPRERADPRRARALRGARGAARRRPTTRRSARAGGARPTCWSPRASCASGRTAPTSRARPTDFPAARRVAALRGPRRRRDRRHRLGRAARHRRRGARAHQHDARGRHLPARRPLLRGRRARPRAAARARAARSRATGTPSPSARPTRTSSGCSTAARRWA